MYCQDDSGSISDIARVVVSELTAGEKARLAGQVEEEEEDPAMLMEEEARLSQPASDSSWACLEQLGAPVPVCFLFFSTMWMLNLQGMCNPYCDFVVV